MVQIKEKAVAIFVLLQPSNYARKHKAKKEACLLKNRIQNRQFAKTSP